MDPDDTVRIAVVGPPFRAAAVNTIPRAEMTHGELTACLNTCAAVLHEHIAAVANQQPVIRGLIDARIPPRGLCVRFIDLHTREPVPGVLVNLVVKVCDQIVALCMPHVTDAAGSAVFDRAELIKHLRLRNRFKPIDYDPRNDPPIELRVNTMNDEQIQSMLDFVMTYSHDIPEWQIPETVASCLENFSYRRYQPMYRPLPDPPQDGALTIALLKTRTYHAS
ncbi:MAG: hypothetical protein GC162_06725 [Planctomycetes bacterium]|nr:hypothetical protein [Planctomycetota bacterium]